MEMTVWMIALLMFRSILAPNAKSVILLAPAALIMSINVLVANQNISYMMKNALMNAQLVYSIILLIIHAMLVHTLANLVKIQTHIAPLVKKTRDMLLVECALILALLEHIQRLMECVKTAQQDVPNVLIA